MFISGNFIIMKTKQIYLALVFSISVSLVFAQQSTKTFKEALSLAQKSNKKTALIFAGSDWCAPCMKLEKNILHTQDFKNLAEDTFVMYKADFPMRKKNKLPKDKQIENEKLAEKYHQNGIFPLVIILNSNGKELGRMSYKDMSPEDYFNKLNSFK